MMHQDFMPHWKKEDQCFEEEKIEVTDRNGKKTTKAYPHDKSIPQRSYEEWLEVVVNPDSKEFYPARNKDGSPIKGTGGKHIITQIIRLRRKDGSQSLYSLGELQAYDAFGNMIPSTCAKPEVWTKMLFSYERIYDQKTNSIKIQNTGTLGTETVYEMPFNEKNLKELFNLRKNDSDIAFTVKDEAASKAVSVRKEANINDTFKLFLKPFDYLFNAEYITAQQKAELRQMAIDEGIIAPSTPVIPQTTAPPKGTYS